MPPMFLLALRIAALAAAAALLLGGVPIVAEDIETKRSSPTPSYSYYSTPSSDSSLSPSSSSSPPTPPTLPPPIVVADAAGLPRGMKDAGGWPVRVAALICAGLHNRDIAEGGGGGAEVLRQDGEGRRRVARAHRGRRSERDDEDDDKCGDDPPPYSDRADGTDRVPAGELPRRRRRAWSDRSLGSPGAADSHRPRGDGMWSAGRSPVERRPSETDTGGYYKSRGSVDHGNASAGAKESDLGTGGATVAFDAVKVLGVGDGLTSPANATGLMFDKFRDRKIGMAKLDPGYDVANAGLFRGPVPSPCLPAPECRPSGLDSVPAPVRLLSLRGVRAA